MGSCKILIGNKMLKGVILWGTYIKDKNLYDLKRIIQR